MKFKIFFVTVFTLSLSSSVIPDYKARYSFERDDFSVTGIRELKAVSEGSYSLKFNARTMLVVSLDFESNFEIKNSKLISKNYKVKIRPKSVDRDQSIIYDYENLKINSSGINSWEAKLDQMAFSADPLNAQIQIRLNLINEINEFYINLIEIKTGEIKKNFYTLDGEETCILNGKNYNCVLLKRFRESDNRTTTYYLIPELDYLFYRIVDQIPEGYQKLEIKELLSFG
ncbi:MAG: hypothetical protein ISQ64_00345 [SAR86 cluster bacterium]|jgi:hypothetical protein|uniref:DUF3108 domain-containing protein n=1 Tax=SAR86 cluster bacterium TaxID=2030880 RepID=A0A937LJF8_9GAMM|nr:hypothetical protein [SAR86 cluster bacterium]